MCHEDNMQCQVIEDRGNRGNVKMKTINGFKNPYRQVGLVLHCSTDCIVRDLFNLCLGCTYKETQLFFALPLSCHQIIWIVLHCIIQARKIFFSKKVSLFVVTSKAILQLYKLTAFFLMWCSFCALASLKGILT